MSDPYVGEIRMFAGDFPPDEWMFCDGQLLPISEYEMLFHLIGTTYGGDGVQTFALPDLRGRLPLHKGQRYGQNFVQGQAGGTEAVTLTVNQIPGHTHPLLASTSQAVTGMPENQVPAVGSALAYTDSGDQPAAMLAPSAVSPAGGNQPHTNMMPYTCLSFIISLFGTYPTR